MHACSKKSVPTIYQECVLPDDLFKYFGVVNTIQSILCTHTIIFSYATGYTTQLFHSITYLTCSNSLTKSPVNILISPVFP